MSPGEKSLGELVRELRERQGLTQAQLAERAQLALSYIMLAESGQKVNLSPSAVGQLARDLGVPSKVLTEAGKDAPR
jgi:transcriptional regulator with XRE-family HTH domain